MVQAFIGSVTGESHTRSSRGNEDSFFIGRGNDGWVCTVVSDGCGSSKYAAQGAKATAELVGESLLRIARKITTQGEGDWIIDDTVTELAECRRRLRNTYGENLLEYSATIVAALYSDRGGFFLHIGDGLGIGFKITSISEGVATLAVGSISPPENGEYANQTFYLSESNWIRHFRLTPIFDSDIILIMTDGAQDALFSGLEPNWDVICSLLHKVSSNSTSAGATIRQALETKEALERSNDDKTIAIFLPEDLGTNTRSVPVSLTFSHHLGAPRAPEMKDFGQPAPERNVDPEASFATAQSPSAFKNSVLTSANTAKQHVTTSRLKLPILGGIVGAFIGALIGSLVTLSLISSEYDSAQRAQTENKVDATITPDPISSHSELTKINKTDFWDVPYQNATPLRHKEQ